MHIPNDPQSRAILELEAQVHALTAMVGLLFADNMAAAKALKQYGATMADDISLNTLMTDDQRAIYRGELASMSANVDRFTRAAMTQWLESNPPPNDSERSSGA